MPVDPPYWFSLIVGASVLIGAVVGIGAGGRKCWRAISEVVKLQNVAARLIAAEMTTNGGGSLLDKVNRIAANHASSEAHYEALEEMIVTSSDVNQKRWSALSEHTLQVADKTETIATELATHRAEQREAAREIRDRLAAVEEATNLGKAVRDAVGGGPAAEGEVVVPRQVLHVEKPE